MLSILIISFIVLLILGMPIAFSIGCASMIYLLFSGSIPLITIPQKAISGIDSFTFLAIPLFILAGELMNTGGVARRIVNFSLSLVGHIKGGLSIVVVLTNMIVAGVSGVALADAAAVGAVLIPAMKNAGYSKGMAAAVNASASIIGPIIPPSVAFVLYAAITNVSVGKLFLAGFLPGVVMGLYLMITCFIIAKKRGYPCEPRASLKTIWKNFKDAFWALMMPVLMIGGILLGVFTPTEAAGVAVFYGLIVGLFVYKELKISQIPSIIIKAGKTASTILIIIGLAQTLAYILTFEKVPFMLINFFKDFTSHAWAFLIVVNIIVLILGCFMEGTAIMIIVVPLLIPLLNFYQIDLIHFGVVFTLNIMIGLLTPPVGLALFLTSGLADAKLDETIKEVWPFLIALFIVLLMVTYIPGVSLWMVNLFN